MANGPWLLGVVRVRLVSGILGDSVLLLDDRLDGVGSLRGEKCVGEGRMGWRLGKWGRRCITTPSFWQFTAFSSRIDVCFSFLVRGGASIAWAQCRLKMRVDPEWDPFGRFS